MPLPPTHLHLLTTPPPPDPNFDALLNILRRDLEENRFVKPQAWKELGCTFFSVFPFSCLEEILPSEWLMLYGRTGYIYRRPE